MNTNELKRLFPPIDYSDLDELLRKIQYTLKKTFPQSFSPDRKTPPLEIILIAREPRDAYCSFRPDDQSPQYHLRIVDAQIIDVIAPVVSKDHTSHG